MTKRKVRKPAQRPHVLEGMGRRILTGNLSAATDDASLRRAFERFGGLEYAKVVLDPATGRSRGFGFVCFLSAECVGAAALAMDGKLFNGRVLQVVTSPAKPA